MTFKQMIQNLAGTEPESKVDIITFDAIVISVDKSNRTCIVDSLDKSINDLKVRYMLEISDGDKSEPEEGSTVAVVMTNFTEPYITKTTWLSEKEIVVGNQSYTIINNKQTFNSDKYGGLAVVESDDNSVPGLVKKISDLEKKYNEILNILKGTTIPLAPSGTYPFAPLYSSVNPIAPLTTAKDISNPNIFHGDKFSENG